MTELLLDDLRDCIANRQVVALIGAGVSIGATDNDPVASWAGLLESGALQCEAVAAGDLPDGWGERVRGEIASGDLDDLLSAADKITRKLGERTGGEYGRWLKDSVGALELRSRDVLDALGDLGVPLVTTNYDALIETATGLEPVTWRDGAGRILPVLRGDESAVLHVHGFWRDPESVVLGVRSYEEVLGDSLAQALLQGLSLGKSWLFVGVGAGLADPNFGALRRWMKDVLAASPYRHFRLAREDELAAARAEHEQSERVTVVSYGENHRDLAPFLRGLAPQGHGGETSSPTTVAIAPTLAARLPMRPRCFGRDDLVRRIAGTLLDDDSAPVAVLGPPGIGKSTLCLAALHEPEVAGRLAGRRYFVRCDGSASADALLAEVGSVIDVEVGPDLAARVLSQLEEAPAALVLDNAETPWEGDTVATEEVLGALAGVTGLALVVALRGGQRPLGPAWREPVHVTPLAAADARKIFLAVAGERYADDDHLGGLLAEVDYVPLAVELLAYQAEGEPDLGALTRRWSEKRVRMLERSADGERQLSVPASVEVSFYGTRMDEDARSLLSLLALLPDGILHDDLTAVLPEAEQAASTLRKVGLAFDEAGRLRVLKPIRDHVADAHPPQPEDLGRAIAHYCALAGELGPQVGSRGGAEASVRLVGESGNLEVMILAGLDDEGTASLGIEAALALANSMRLSGIGSTSTLERAQLAAQTIGDPLYRANCIKSLGNIALARSQHEEASSRFEQALPLYRQMGAVLGEANCIESLGDIALERSQHEEASSRYEQALPLYCQVGDVLGEANCIVSLGAIALARSQHEEASSRFEQALPLHRQVGDVLGEANCIKSLGDIALERSQHEEASSRFEQALPLYRQVGAVLGEATCIKSLGDIALERSQHEEASSRFEQALPLHRQVGDVLGEANCILSLGTIALARSQHEEASSRFEQALPLYRQVGAVLGEANCIKSLGNIALARSQHEEASSRFEQALYLYGRIPEPYSVGQTHRQLARIATDDSGRRSHTRSAKEAWASIDRHDLIEQIDAEFDEL